MMQSMLDHLDAEAGFKRRYAHGDAEDDLTIHGQAIIEGHQQIKATSGTEAAIQYVFEQLERKGIDPESPEGQEILRRTGVE